MSSSLDVRLVVAFLALTTCLSTFSSLISSFLFFVRDVCVVFLVENKDVYVVPVAAAAAAVVRNERRL